MARNGDVQMGVPRKIREAAEAADAAIAEITRLESQPLVVDPVTGQPPAAPVEPTPAPTEDFAQKYRTLQGKYDSEVPLLRSQLQNYERVNQQLSSQLASLSDQVRILQSQPAAPAPAGTVGGVTDADVAQYGPELIDLVRRIAAETSTATGQSLKDVIAREVGAVRADVTHVQVDQQVTARKSYEDGLTVAVPNWREINATREFLEWLGEYDPLLGSTRQQAVTAAYNSYDVPRTVAFLQRYLALQVPQAPALTPQEELARQVSPRGTGAPTPVDTTVQQPGRIWTQQEIAEAYTAQIQGRNRLPQAQWEKLEAEISLAAAEGRVR